VDARLSIMRRLLRVFGHQEWIRYGLRDRVLRYFCNPIDVASCPFEIDFFGFKYLGDLSSYIDWAVYFYGGYEKQELFLLRDLARAKSDPVFVDVGANVGQHSLFMSKFCSQVHAFEPYVPVRQQLETKIAANNVKNIVVHEVGLGEAHQELDFFAPTGRNLGTGSFVPTNVAGNRECSERLEVVNGDNYFDHLQLDKIDLIKIDVEGFEKSVLLGLTNTLRKHRPTVVLEFSDDTRNAFNDPDELTTLVPKGYSINLVMSNRKFLHFFNRAGYSRAKFDFQASVGNLLLEP
jgi:FkbM family methyltransferase